MIFSPVGLYSTSFGGRLPFAGGSPVQEDHQANGRLLFGFFEVDLRAGELRKNGLRVRLQAQLFQVLGLLLENAGKVVTREKLQRKLWPAYTFVHFDHGLDKAIDKIREARNDSAESPRFAETVARRVYHFLAEARLAKQRLLAVRTQLSFGPQWSLISFCRFILPSTMFSRLSGQFRPSVCPFESPFAFVIDYSVKSR